jgi:hypothetical protein
MRTPSWKDYNSWIEIKSFCEANDFTVDDFTVYDFSFYDCAHDKIITKVYKHFNELTLQIYIRSGLDISSIMNNLPTNIDNLYINISQYTEIKYLENKFTNLPFSLKKIKFVYEYHKFPEIKTVESEGRFNLLFGIKIPFNCEIVVNYKNMDYIVKYIESGSGSELELRTDKQIFKIKVGERIFKIKYKVLPPSAYNGGGGGGGGRGGGLMQLVSYGAQDIYLTEKCINPQPSAYNGGGGGGSGGRGSGLMQLVSYVAHDIYLKEK